MRRVLPRVCCHETCTLHDTSKRGPRKHVTGMHCSIVVVPRKITCVKMKLQLSGTVILVSFVQLFQQFYMHNAYSEPGRLFITGQGAISSSKGTTQGDPPAITMYAFAVTPLIKQLQHLMPDVKQVWYADDATAARKLNSLHIWW